MAALFVVATGGVKIDRRVDGETEPHSQRRLTDGIVRGLEREVASSPARGGQEANVSGAVGGR